MSTEASKRASKRYAQKNVKAYTLQLNKKTDADIITWLEVQSNKQGYLKALIRKDLEKN